MARSNPGPGIGARAPLSACPSGSPRDQLAQPTEVSGPSGRGRPGREGSGRGLGERRGERDPEDGAGSGEGGARRGAGPEGWARGRAAPGGGRGRPGKPAGSTGQRSYWGRDRGAWFYGRGFWRGGGACKGGVPARDWSLQLQVIWSLELGLPDGPRDSPAAASELLLAPSAACVELTPPAHSPAWSLERQPHAREEGPRRCSAAELCRS